MPCQKRLGNSISRLSLLAFALAGCTVFACRPVTVSVAKKGETARLDTGPAPLRTTETGRIEEGIRPTVVREYWVETPEGQWYRVSADQFRAAEVGRALEVCQ
jgi:hypothetical protein